MLGLTSHSSKTGVSNLERRHSQTPRLAAGSASRPSDPFAAMLVVATATALVACKPVESAAPPRKPEPPANVRLTQARQGEITRSISLPATVAANQQVTLYSKVAGYLKAIAVDRGDAVAEGASIAEIEAPELLADLSRSKAEFEIAQLEFQRASDAHGKAPDLVIRQAVDTAKAKMEMARANLERVQTLIGFCRITAPFSGVITRRFVDPGAFIPAATSGSAAQTAALVTLVDFSTVRVQVAVPEAEVPLIRRGLPVTVTIAELPGRTFEGVITRFSHALDETSKTMLAEVDLPNSEGMLRPGMFATAKIGVEKRADAVLLPAEAVLFEKSGPSIFTVSDNKARKIPVKVGFSDGMSVQILEGIQPGANAVLVGKMPLANGQTVNVMEAQ